ncbi:hypothetical protein TYRP_013401 [Tyrophagus putrescentiae]|nr:hypothetical protein TYRP_013401 [Tyrophagus putrescentiae]
MDITFTATTTDPLALSISGAPPGSGLAAINNNNDNSNGTTNSAPPSSGNNDFTNCDTDLHLKKLAELYSYNEELMEDYGYPLKWTLALPGQRASADSSSGSDGASWCPSQCAECRPSTDWTPEDVYGREVELVEAAARQDEDKEARRLVLPDAPPIQGTPGTASGGDVQEKKSKQRRLEVML